MENLNFIVNIDNCFETENPLEKPQWLSYSQFKILKSKFSSKEKIIVKFETSEQIEYNVLYAQSLDNFIKLNSQNIQINLETLEIFNGNFNSEIRDTLFAEKEKLKQFNNLNDQEIWFANLRHIIHIFFNSINNGSPKLINQIIITKFNFYLNSYIIKEIKSEENTSKEILQQIVKIENLYKFPMNQIYITYNKDTFEDYNEKYLK